MFSLSYLWAEVRRRKGRTILTALGLGVGVALVVTVTALSAGLDKAQDEVLAPLTGVGSDLSVTRPIDIENVSAGERAQLQEENGGGRFSLRDLAEPGEKFEDDRFASSQLSFDAGAAADVAALDGAADAAAGLTISSLHIAGTMPDSPGAAPDIDVKSLTAKVAAAAPPGGAAPRLAAVFGQGQVTSGSQDVVLTAPVDFGLIVLAISLALLGGLLAGAAGGLRTARLRPADALRHID